MAPQSFVSRAVDGTIPSRSTSRAARLDYQVPDSRPRDGSYATTLALLVASFTSRRAYASVFLVGLFVITAPFTVGLAREIGGAAGQWISMFNLTSIPVHVNDLIFGERSEVTDETPASLLPAWVWWAGISPGSWCRVRCCGRGTGGSHHDRQRGASGPAGRRIRG